MWYSFCLLYKTSPGYRAVGATCDSVHWLNKLFGDDLNDKLRVV